METRDALSAYGNPLIIIGSRYRGKKKPKEKGKKKKRDGAQLSARDRGEINARRERNTVIDGYQAVEHECCFVRGGE